MSHKWSTDIFESCLIVTARNVKNTDNIQTKHVKYRGLHRKYTGSDKQIGLLSNGTNSIFQISAAIRNIPKIEWLLYPRKLKRNFKLWPLNPETLLTHIPSIEWYGKLFICAYLYISDISRGLSSVLSYQLQSWLMHSVLFHFD